MNFIFIMEKKFHGNSHKIINTMIINIIKNQYLID